MFDFLSGLFSSPFIIPVVAIVAGLGVPIISSAWASVERHKQECELKRSMVERGMSVDEIERVLQAGSSSDKKH